MYPRIGVGLYPARVGDMVVFGVMPDGDVHVCRLAKEAGCERGLSIDSHLGRALMGRRAGDVVDVIVDDRGVHVKLCSVSHVRRGRV